METTTNLRLKSERKIVFSWRLREIDMFCVPSVAYGLQRREEIQTAELRLEFVQKNERQTIHQYERSE